MITKFFVGQTVYVAGSDGKTVSKGVVTSITCKTTVEGCGGPYDSYSFTDSWRIEYQVDDSPAIVAESLIFGNPRDAFDSMGRRVVPEVQS
jgi:hypothetical protein